MFVHPWNEREKGESEHYQQKNKTKAYSADIW